MADRETYYLVEEVAKRLRVCEMTIYRWIKAKKLLALKIGKGYRISSMELKDFIDRAEVKEGIAKL